MSLSLPTICITILLKSKYDERPVSLWHNKNDNTLKNIHLKTLTKTEIICNKNTNENAHNRQFRHRNCSQSARAVEKWEGLAYAYECVIPAKFYCCSLFFDLLTLNFFWHLVQISLSHKHQTLWVNNDPVAVSHYYSTKRSSMLPRQSTCCQSGRRRTS